MKEINVVELNEEERHKLFENQQISADNIIVPSCYQEPFMDYCEPADYEKLSEEEKRGKTPHRYFVFSSGRVSGKTSILVFKWWERINNYPDRDIVILQATTVEIKDSIINEIAKFLQASGKDVGEDVRNEYYIPKAHDRIIIKGQKGQTYFYPITDSKGGQRSRGINTPNKVSLVLYEEAQKNTNRDVLDQSIITFIRQLDKDAQMIVVGNNETVGHWFIDFVEDKKQDPEWAYIYSCYKDIWNLLNEQTQSYILNYKLSNPIEYRRIFLGDIRANTSDVVFPQFKRENNYKMARDLKPQTFTHLIIGVDHATANDTFAVVPVAILRDGTTQTLEVCYDDPEDTQQTLAPTEQCDILEEFVDFLDNKYGLKYNQVKVLISVDGAASPFIAQLKHTKATSKNKELWRTIQIKGFTMKKKDINLGILKNAFAFGVLTILNEGLYNWKREKNGHRLCHEIEAQRYKHGKLDEKIKNDLVDALEYACIPYYTNCYNLSFPKRYADCHYDDIRHLANLK